MMRFHRFAAARTSSSMPSSARLMPSAILPVSGSGQRTVTYTSAIELTVQDLLPYCAALQLFSACRLLAKRVLGCLILDDLAVDQPTAPWPAVDPVIAPRPRTRCSGSSSSGRYYCAE